MTLKKKVTRREFMRLSGLATAGVVVAACGGVPEDAAPAATEPAESAAPAEAEAPIGPPTKFNEAPMLADLVAAGDLPPVDERLPLNPLVLDSLEGIGNYGGTIRRGFKGVSDRWGPTKMQNEALTWYNPDLTVRPNLCESWEINEDGSTWTFNLREGTRWSDGHPLDADSFKWWYENHLLNETLTPSPPSHYSTGSPAELATMEFPDQNTVLVKFAHPKPLFAFTVTRRPGLGTDLAPGHYMSQFHADLTDDPAGLEAAVAEAGFETWDQYYTDRNWWYLNPARPQGGPWISKNALSEELFLMERNPYFWQVDSSANQLPYVDKVNHRLFENNEVFDLWITGGEIDFQARHVGGGDKFTLYKTSEESGDYQVMIGASAGHTAFQPNHTAQNPLVREFFQDPKVRIALSLAVNRDEMNELFADGLSKPRQYSPLSSSPNFYEKLSNAYIEYDVDQANALLDEAGYTERDADDFRLWKDGSGAVSFVIEGTAQSGTPAEDTVLYVVRAWEEIGIKASYRGMERSLYEERWASNALDAAWWGGDRSVLPIVAPWIFLGTMIDRPWAAAWGLWKRDESNPVGEAPPEDHWIRNIWDIWDQVEGEPDEVTRNILFEGIMDIWAEQLPMIGFLGDSPKFVIVKNGFRGYLPGYPIDDTIEDEHLLNTQTYYWDDPDAHT